MPHTEARREAIAAWLTANNIDPADVPLHSMIVEDSEAGTIRYTAYVRAEGRLQVAPAGGPRVIQLDDLEPPMYEAREAPLVVPAPGRFPA